MTILIIGSGGREHALAWKILQSSKLNKIFITPGNAGTAQVGENLGISDTAGILKWLKFNKVDLVVVGPDNYLAEGIVDKIQKIGILVFGPTKAAAKIEWSKSYAKQIMKSAGIPTAQGRVFNNFLKALKYIKNKKFPIVLKADGLAFGKGVAIAKNFNGAKKTLEKMMEEKVFGKAGTKVIIEEYLVGNEISVHAFCDGKDAIMFPASRDHKRVYDGNKGLNTGGMGTIAPVPGVIKSDLEEIKQRIILPILQELKNRGIVYQGVLFPGIMMTKNGPKVIEFNARFGDPETQSYLLLLKTDLVDIMLACIHGKLKNIKIKWKNKFACCVIVASKGYPGKYKTGFEITGLSNSNEIVFQAGTKLSDGKIVTNGGRVFGVTAIGNTLSQAGRLAYKALKKIYFRGMYFRKDIGAAE